MLHEAMKDNRIDVFDVFMERFNYEYVASYLYLRLMKLLNVVNLDENTFLSIAIISDADDDVIISMMEKLSYDQTLPLCELSDRDNNTILHLAMKFACHKLVRYLAKKPVDEMN